MPYLQKGDTLPTFRYDAPYAPQQPVAELYRKQPAVMVFLSNFGHPITRELIQNYLQDEARLAGCRLACVVRSRHESVERALQGHEMPFTLICDAEGALYEHFEIPQEANPLRCVSLRAAAILRRAKKAGYNPAKGQPQQMPLTLVVDTNGTVLFAHYGRSLTDVPENCAAVSELAAQAVAAFQPEEPVSEEPMPGETPEQPEMEQAEQEPAEPEYIKPETAEVPPVEEPLPEVQADEPQEQPLEAAPEPAAQMPEPEQAEETDENENARQPEQKYQSDGFTLESFFGAGPEK